MSQQHPVGVPPDVEDRRTRHLHEALPLVDRHLGSSDDWYTVARYAKQGNAWLTWTACFSADIEALGQAACEAQMALSVPSIERGLAEGYANVAHIAFAMAHHRSLAFKEGGLRPHTSQILHRADHDRIFSLKLNPVQLRVERHVDVERIKTIPRLRQAKGFVRWTPDPLADLRVGCSTNWATGQPEAGLSCLALNGPLAAERAVLSYRSLPGRAYIFHGDRVGTGSDGEDVIAARSVAATVDDALVQQLVALHGPGPHHLPPAKGGEVVLQTID